MTAALIDSGHDDYMLETAMLKVFATDVLWRIINDTIQIFGGKAYFTDEPYERMMRDARINMIGEGANDVLRAFVALVGMRDVGLELQSVVAAFKRPLKHFGKISDFLGRRVESLFRPPEVSVAHAELEPDAQRLGKLVARFSSNVERLLRTHREAIVDQEYQLGRIGEAAIELYVSACVLRRLEATLGRTDHGGTILANGEALARKELIVGRHYLRTAERRIQSQLAALWDNDDRSTTQTADLLLP
jgi:acyl-CoA dehydrogenase family protein 9